MMFFSVWLLLCMFFPLVYFIFDVHSQSTTDPFIINGDKAPEGRWPFMASLQGQGGGHFCGGTVLNDDSIITAAHCMDRQKPENVFVYLGHVNLEKPDSDYRFQAKQWIGHPNWNNNDFDIGILKLAKKINFTSLDGKVNKTCLPLPEDKPIADKCMAIGWGQTEQGSPPMDLLQVSMPVLDNSADGCYNRPVDKFVCAGYSKGGKDICYGDSGGPLLCPIVGDEETFYQFGISALLGAAKCGKKPSAFTRISTFLDFVKKNAEN